jgi:hypothetical protein
MTPTRGQLHAWIWQVPLTQLAPVLHLSSKALNRTCVKHRIPTPPRGHWRRIETGQAAGRIPLPDPDVGGDLALEVDEAAIAALLADRVPMPASSGSGDASALASQDGIGGSSAPEIAMAIDPQVLPVEPSLDSILELAERHGRWLLADAFVEQICAAMPTCDPATRAVLTLWTDRAREALARGAPIALVIGSCERIASGVEVPTWWTSVSRKDS